MMITLAICSAFTARRPAGRIADHVRSRVQTAPTEAGRRVPHVNLATPGTTAAGVAVLRPGHALHVPTSRPTPSTQVTADCPARAAGRAAAGTTRTGRHVLHARR